MRPTELLIYRGFQCVSYVFLKNTAFALILSINILKYNNGLSRKKDTASIFTKTA